MHWNIEKRIDNSEILVVDDNVVNQKVLGKVLESKGYGVNCASDGPEALEKANEILPDLILLDVQMPEMDGFEVCRRLKAKAETEDIPVIFITATDTIEGKVEGFKAGAADYIPRPLQMPEVLARVGNQLTIQMLKRNANEEKDRLQKILGALPVPYMISKIDDGQIIEMNEKAGSALDVAHEDIKKYKSTDFYATPQIRPRLVELVQRNGLVANEEIELITRTGVPFTSLFSATPLCLGGVDVFFVTFSDITERKETELALEKAATTDYLTGILNRRAFIERCVAERQRSNRNKNPICMLMIDIDHFKAINDTHGHDIGDDALKVLVELVGHNLRLTDAFGRLGGEEFALLLPETDLKGALILAERIRERVEKNEMVLADGKVLTMTISSGLAEWTADMSYDQVLKLVDERLYAAKNNGRNQVVAS
ncbi:diguanylate cyclase [Terasakiella sp. A23]|uniref:diguanylate cyclase n=1 Tax=Terasakiella sp. FCG-A23 TaxID=3080561 RepID=UPI0029543990|nr:diguanylate cyclase [Terasakiella sp. A23]MDV7340275.1 diguanylate cyclase [Terasakiella sp. A23]